VRFPSPVLLVVSAVLALAVLPSASAAPGGTRNTGRSDRAERTLAAVQAAFSGATTSARHPAGATADGRELTLLLARLRSQLDDLGKEDRTVARAFLARPTDSGDPFVRYSRTARATNDCRVARTKGSKVCVHWARATRHAPDRADRDHDGLPNQVERTRDVANQVWRRLVADGGYRRPPRDHGGPNGRLDIYLADIGAARLYGYCVTEDRVSGRAHTGYCVLDDDYSRREFPAHTPGQNLKVTAAHELFHVVQFGYDAFAASWFMEGTAAWVEDEVYDAVDDNHIYLPTSPLAHPEHPLDRVAGLSIYGSWIFWRFLTERHPDEGGTGLPLLVRRLWEDVDQLDRTRPGIDVFDALRNALGDHGTTLPETYADFAVANRRPADRYEEGSSYSPSPLARGHVLPVGAGVRDVAVVDRLSSATVELRPGSGLPRDGALELSVSHRLAGDAGLRIVVVGRAGGVHEVPVRRTEGGWSAIAPGFDRSATRSVEMTLVNGASRRGADNATFDYTAAVLPPGP
jgi:hypothetical protein